MQGGGREVAARVQADDADAAEGQAEVVAALRRQVAQVELFGQILRRPVKPVEKSIG